MCNPLPPQIIIITGKNFKSRTQMAAEFVVENRYNTKMVLTVTLQLHYKMLCFDSSDSFQSLHR